MLWFFFDFYGFFLGFFLCVANRFKVKLCQRFVTKCQLPVNHIRCIGGHARAWHSMRFINIFCTDIHIVKMYVTRIESESENCSNCRGCCCFLALATTQNALLNVLTPFRSSYRASNGPHQWAAARSAILMSSHYLRAQLYQLPLLLYLLSSDQVKIGQFH